MAKLAVRSIGDISKKWVDVTPTKAAYYEAGVKAPKADWATEAGAASTIYKSAVSNPAIDKLFSAGIKRAGTAKWQRKATSVGVSRFGPGVTAAQPDYESGFSPYLDELSKVEVPERKPRGDETNYERVKTIGKALNKKRLALAAVS
jgi:hypothetical protein